jgi:hypothetical protein
MEAKIGKARETGPSLCPNPKYMPEKRIMSQVENALRTIFKHQTQSGDRFVVRLSNDSPVGHPEAMWYAQLGDDDSSLEGSGYTQMDAIMSLAYNLNDAAHSQPEGEE